MRTNTSIETSTRGRGEEGGVVSRKAAPQSVFGGCRDGGGFSGSEKDERNQLFLGSEPVETNKVGLVQGTSVLL